MIFGVACAVTGFYLGAQLADLAGQSGTVVGTTIGIIGAAIMSGVAVQLIRTLGKQGDVSDRQVSRLEQEIDRLNRELESERTRCTRIDADNERLRDELSGARGELDRLRRQLAGGT